MPCLSLSSDVKLDHMNYHLPNEVIQILNKLADKGYQAYIVGGAVRDLILGRDIKDWDFTTDANPGQILEIFSEGFLGKDLQNSLTLGEPFYNNQFGTVGISSDLGLLEITTMRKESNYHDFRRPEEVEWTDKIAEDLKRRDFTINALALNKNQEIIDPFSAKEDINKKIIRAVGNPDKRFNEDALRLMRAVRLSTQLDFEIEKDTFSAVKKNSHLITKISWERIRDELFKILGSNNPRKGVELLRSGGLLKFIIPELEECFGLVQEGPKHNRVYDIGEHSLSSLEHCPSKDPLIRFIALIHDIGKPKTVNIQSDGNVTFYEHDVAGAKIAKTISQRLKLSNKDTEKVERLVRWHLFTVDENQTDSAIRRFIKNVGQENIEDMMAVRVADRLGGGTATATSWRMEKFKERIKQVLHKPFSIADLKLNGEDVMKELSISPSRKVGEILQKLFEEVLEDNSKNNKEYLLKRTKQLT